eukprot:1201046-Rhodomonas_salina.1
MSVLSFGRQHATQQLSFCSFTTAEIDERCLDLTALLTPPAFSILDPLAFISHLISHISHSHVAHCTSRIAHRTSGLHANGRAADDPSVAGRRDRGEGFAPPPLRPPSALRVSLGPRQRR